MGGFDMHAAVSHVACTGDKRCNNMLSPHTHLTHFLCVLSLCSPVILVLLYKLRAFCLASSSLPPSLADVMSPPPPNLIPSAALFFFSLVCLLLLGEGRRRRIQFIWFHACRRTSCDFAKLHTPSLETAACSTMANSQLIDSTHRHT